MIFAISWSTAVASFLLRSTLDSRTNSERFLKIVLLLGGEVEGPANVGSGEGLTVQDLAAGPPAPRAGG